MSSKDVYVSKYNCHEMTKEYLYNKLKTQINIILIHVHITKMMSTFHFSFQWNGAQRSDNDFSIPTSSIATHEDRFNWAKASRSTLTPMSFWH